MGQTFFQVGEGAGVGKVRVEEHVAKNKCITIHVSKTTSCELTGSAEGLEGRGGEAGRLTHRRTEGDRYSICKKTPPCDAGDEETEEKAPFRYLTVCC